MLTLLANVKLRLGLTELEIQYDALLAALIAGVSARFNLECRRTFGRTVNATYEFPAERLLVCPPASPVESIAAFHLKTSEAAGWEAINAVPYIIRRACVVEFGSPLGLPGQQARVTYTGGYILPGDTPAPGQAPLPREIEHAATEQTAYWFQNREHLGLERLWEYHGTYRQYGDLDLLDSVKAVLRPYQRWIV